MNLKGQALPPGTQVEVRDNCTVCRFRDETGTGEMTVYEAFPGVMVIFNAFHMERFCSEERSGGNMLFIDHCRIGKIVWEAADHSCIYCEAGDIQINTNFVPNGVFHFPLKHYHGVTIAWDLDELKHHPVAGVLDHPVDLERLKGKLCPKGEPLVIRASQRIENVLSELYNQTPDTIVSYCRLKAMEVLLFLETTDVAQLGKRRAYCSKVQVEKVRAIERAITEQADKRYTLSELSERFDFPLTSMKQCFKCVYGVPIYTYLKNFRMNKAALLLRQTDKSILEIAGCVGYENAGKFSEAFTSVMGKKPFEYRRQMNREKK